MRPCFQLSVACSLCTIASALAGVKQFGDMDVCNTRSWPTDPTTGATLEGLAPGVVTTGTAPVGHSFPFAPTTGDYPGTDQIFTGSRQTGTCDGYGGYGSRRHGPHVITMDYGSLVGASEHVTSLTLGIGFDDFQQPFFGQPYLVTVNGISYAPLSALVSSMDQTGPVAQFKSIGLPVSLLDGDQVLTLSIDQGGNGGDGWAIDFLTIGVTTQYCFGDLDGSGVIDTGDVARCLLDFGPCVGCASDLDATGEVDFGDVALILISIDSCS